MITHFCGEPYKIVWRDLYERALDDPSLLGVDGASNAYIVALMRNHAMHLQGIEDRFHQVLARPSATQEDQTEAANPVDIIDNCHVTDETDIASSTSEHEQSDKSGDSASEASSLTDDYGPRPRLYRSPDAMLAWDRAAPCLSLKISLANLLKCSARTAAQVVPRLISYKYTV